MKESVKSTGVWSVFLLQAQYPREKFWILHDPDQDKAFTKDD